MKIKNGRLAFCLFLALGLVYLCVASSQAQLLSRMFGNKKTSSQGISPEIVQALRPSESDLEAAGNVRNALIDTERVQQSRVEGHTLQAEGIKLEVYVDQFLRDFPLEPPKREIDPEVMERFLRDYPPGTPQVAIETRFLECPSQFIAPKGMLPEQGWVVLPIAHQQKAPAALRVKDLLSEENANMAVGALNITEQYSPTLIRFIETKDFSTILQLCQGDSRSNVLQAPKITMFSGQPGQVNDTIDRYYCWSNSKDHPIVEALQEGVSVQLQPEVLEDGSVHLKEFQAAFNRIIGQERYALSPDDEVVLAIPKLQTRQFNLPVTIPAGKTLLVALPQPFDGGWVQEAPRGSRVNDRHNTLCLAITCQVIAEEMMVESTQNVKRIKQEMFDSENKRQVEKEDGIHTWIKDKPSNMIQERLAGVM